MTRQTETGHVGAGVDGVGGHHLRGRLGQGGDLLQTGCHGRLRNPAFAVGVEEHAGAQGFGEDQAVARTGGGVAPDLVRVYQAVDG